jgi:hypothetical protein
MLPLIRSGFVSIGDNAEEVGHIMTSQSTLIGALLATSQWSPERSQARNALLDASTSRTTPPKPTECLQTNIEVDLLDLRHLIRSGYRSVAGKLGPFRAVKTGLGERPKKRGSPEEQNIYRRIQSFYCSIIMTIYCVCCDFQQDLKIITVYLVKERALEAVQAAPDQVSDAYGRRAEQKNTE